MLVSILCIVLMTGSSFLQNDELYVLRFYILHLDYNWMANHDTFGKQIAHITMDHLTGPKPGRLQFIYSRSL